MRAIEIPSYITRPIYVERLNPLMGKDVIKVLVGQRRVGKSYLLYHVVDMIKERDPACPILYINKELAAFDDIRTDADLLEVTGRQLGSSRRGCVLIDEVQEIDNWPRALRSLAAEKRFDIYCTGSNAEMLSGDIATLLAGRAVEVPVRGLAYREFLTFHRLDERRPTPASSATCLRYRTTTPRWSFRWIPSSAPATRASATSTSASSC